MRDSSAIDAAGRRDTDALVVVIQFMRRDAAHQPDTVAGKRSAAGSRKFSKQRASRTAFIRGDGRSNLVWWPK